MYSLFSAKQHLYVLDTQAFVVKLYPCLFITHTWILKQFSYLIKWHSKPFQNEKMFVRWSRMLRHVLLRSYTVQ